MTVAKRVAALALMLLLVQSLALAAGLWNTAALMSTRSLESSSSRVSTSLTMILPTKNANVTL
jgi:hypothetical protein